MYIFFNGATVGIKEKWVYDYSKVTSTMVGCCKKKKSANHDFWSDLLDCTQTS